MGNTDSIPLISQVKSLVQVIGGDAAAARKTQENFARQGILVSQLNSLGQSIAGNNREAERIQEEFGKAQFDLAKSLPVVGHGIAAGYAIGGDTEEAENIALGATKSTLIAVAGAAGAVCGPAAVACGSAFGTATSTGWDGAESGIRGELTGSLKQWDDLATGKATIGEGFDLIGGHVIDVAVGAVGAKTALKARKKIGNRAKASKGPSSRCKRSIGLDNDLIYDMTLPDLPADWKPQLPGNISEMAISDNLPVEAIVANTISFILILKLISIGHVASKPYVKEICENRYSHLAIEDCSWMFVEAMSKFENNEVATPSDFMIGTKEDPNLLLADTLDGLDFEVKNFNKHTLIGHFLKVFACQNSTNINDCFPLETYVEEKLNAIQSLINRLKTKYRQKRGRCSKTPGKKNADKTQEAVGGKKKTNGNNNNDTPASSSSGTNVQDTGFQRPDPDIGFKTYRHEKDTYLGGNVKEFHWHEEAGHAKFSNDYKIKIDKRKQTIDNWFQVQKAIEHLDSKHSNIPNYSQYRNALVHVQQRYPKPTLAQKTSYYVAQGQGTKTLHRDVLLGKKAHMPRSEIPAGNPIGITTAFRE